MEGRGAAEADVLAGHHHQLEDLGVVEVFTQDFDVGVADVVVVDRHPLGEFDRGALGRAVVGVGGEVLGPDADRLILGDALRGEPRRLAGDAAVEDGDPQPHQLLHPRRDPGRVLGRIDVGVPGVIELEVLLFVSPEGALRSTRLSRCPTYAGPIGWWEAASSELVETPARQDLPAIGDTTKRRAEIGVQAPAAWLAGI